MNKTVESILLIHHLKPPFTPTQLYALSSIDISDQGQRGEINKVHLKLTGMWFHMAFTELQ